MAVTIRSGPVAKALAKDVLPIKSNKHVAFDESRNVEYENKQWSAEEGRQSWYSALDYQAIKTTAHAQAKQVWVREKRLNLENSYKNVILRAYDCCCDVEQETDGSVLSADDQAMFAEIMGKSNSRTGLEKICIREIAHDKRYRRGQIVEAVLALQASSKAGSRRARTELIRLASESISRASRLFARHMAVALAAGLQEE